jgi:hypothetical protein
MASDRDPSRLPRVLELSVAAALSYEEPAIVAKPGEHITNFHRRRNLTLRAAFNMTRSLSNRWRLAT